MQKTKEMLEYEQKQKEEMKSCVEILRRIVQSEDSHVLGARFVETFFAEIESDDESNEKIGFYAMQDICNDNLGNFIMSVCGWTIRTLMLKSKLMKDTELEYNDEVIDAVYVAKSEDDEDVIHKHKCKINMKTFEVFDIECEDYADDTNEEDCFKDEWIEIDGGIYPLYPQDESEGLPYHVFWYGENE